MGDNFVVFLLLLKWLWYLYMSKMSGLKIIWATVARTVQPTRGKNKPIERATIKTIILKRSIET